MIKFKGINHHSVLVSDIDQSIYFYKSVLGLEMDENRPDTMSVKGAWFHVGLQAIHLTELPNPDANSIRPEHGGHDRHVALECETFDALLTSLDDNNVIYTKSSSGRDAIFFRDPDQNAIEVIAV